MCKPGMPARCHEYMAVSVFANSTRHSSVSGLPIFVDAHSPKGIRASACPSVIAPLRTLVVDCGRTQASHARALALLSFTGLHLVALPYATKWRIGGKMKTSQAHPRIRATRNSAMRRWASAFG